MNEAVGLFFLVYCYVFANVAFNGHVPDFPRGHALIMNAYDLVVVAFSSRSELVGDERAGLLSGALFDRVV